MVGQHGDRLKIALRAPPVDGRANAALLEFVAGRLGLGTGQVSIVAGAHSRDKAIEVRVHDAPSVVAALAAG